MQQQKDPLDNKTSFNVGYTLMLMHALGTLVICRDQWGPRVLGRPCVGAFVLMLGWASFSRDPLMYFWIALWGLYYIKRRTEALQLAKSGEVHTHSDGRPRDALKYCKSVGTAKLIIEPILVGILGIILFQGYQYMGWSPYGLPYYLLAGCFSLPFVQSVKNTIWNRRVESLNDARLENEQLVEELRNRRGN